MFTQREKIIFFVTVSTFIAAVGFQLFVSPLMAKNKSLQTEIKTAQTRLMRYRMLLSQRDALEKAYGSFFSGNDISAPAHKSSGPILAQLDKYASDSGIRVLDIRPQSSGQSAQAAEPAIDMRVEGELAGIMKFVSRMERCAGVAQIKRLRVNVKPGTRMLEAGVTVVQSGRI